MVFMLLVIASFVVYFTPTGQNGGGGNAQIGSIDGRPISRQEYQNAQIEARLGYFLQYGDWPKPGPLLEYRRFNLERQTMERLFLNTRLQQQHIEVGDEAVAKQVAALFRNSKSTASIADQYNNMVQNTLKPQGITDEDFRRFLRHELGGQQLSSTVSASGRLLSPAVAESAYRYENERVEVKAAFFNASNYVAKVTKIDPAALSQFYSNKVSNYRSPKLVQVDYVSFEPINYLLEAGKKLAQSTNLAVQLDAEYYKLGTNSFVDEKGKVMSAEQAKSKLKDDKRQQLAQKFARQAAYEFANDLSGMEPVKLQNLTALAGKKGFKTYTTEPFSMLDGPKGIEDARNFSQQAFSLDSSKPFGEPVPVGDSYYVLGFKKSIPSQLQPLEKVRQQVEKDYTEYRAQQLAREAGKNFAQAVTNALASGKSFADVAKGQKVKVVNVAPFARNARSVPELEMYSVSAQEFVPAAFSRKAGEATGYMSSNNPGMGFVLFVEKFMPADEMRMKAELPEYLEELRSRSASMAYNDWITRQFEAAAPSGPGMK